MQADRAECRHRGVLGWEMRLADHSRPYNREPSGTLSQASLLRAAKMSGKRWRRHSILGVFICGTLKVMSIAKM